jgi:hypothetical protein
LENFSFSLLQVDKKPSWVYPERCELFVWAMKEEKKLPEHDPPLFSIEGVFQR